MSDFPEVVHVGFSKCASTFLRSLFSQHPATFLVGDAHYYVPFERCNYDRGLEYYADRFRAAHPKQIKVESDEHIVLPLLHPVLRAAATTLDSVRIASDRIRQTNPDTKIILVIRNQSDLILSRYGEYIMSGHDISFDDFVDEFLACSTDGTNYYQNYYSEVIGVFTSDFGKDNVIVLLQEDLYSNEDAAIQRLCGFLDIPAPDPEVFDGGRSATRWFSLDAFRVVARSGRNSKNTGLSLTGIRAMRLWNKLVVIEPEEAYYKKASARLPYFIYKFGVRALRVIDHYLPKSLKGNKNTLLTTAIVERIRAEFEKDNKNLARLLGRDLDSLGY